MASQRASGSKGPGRVDFWDSVDCGNTGADVTITLALKMAGSGTAHYNHYSYDLISLQPVDIITPNIAAMVWPEHIDTVCRSCMIVTSLLDCLPLVQSLLPYADVSIALAPFLRPPLM